MQRRHANELVSRLERIADIGFAEIRNRELLRWYEQERISKGIWRDVEERWRELEEDQPLFVGWADGTWKFLNGEGLQLAPDSWLTEVKNMSKKADADT